MLREPIPFGKYLLLDRISVGGMAEVFKAKAFGVEGFEKILAIKRILPTMIEDEDFIEMFIDEAKIAGQLNHANICQIFELGRFDRAHYIAMEYISGKDLLQIMGLFQRQEQAFPLSVAGFIIAKLCEGLDYAHRKRDPAGNSLNIIHRDVSPQNVIVSFNGEIKLIDFGIAKARYRSSKTAAGVLKGKFGYMSPEQVRGLRLDRRSDVFALGTLLYEMISGVRLFVGESDFATLEKVRNVDVSSPTRYNPSIPPELESIVMKALARTPEARYQWANELQEDLQSFLLTQKPLMTTKRLAAWMGTHFSEDIQREREEHELFLQIKTPQQPPPAPGQGRQLPDFDAFDEDDEETALMKDRQREAGALDVMVGSTTPGSRKAATQAMSEHQGGDIHGESTVIFWSEDDEVPEGATMILPPEEDAPEGATMILPPDEDATHILDEDGVVEGIPLSAVGAAASGVAASSPGAATSAPPGLPAGLPEPKVRTDPFGLPSVKEPISTDGPARSDTAEVDLKSRGGRTSPLLLGAVGLAAAVVFGLLGFLLGRPGERPKPPPPPPPPPAAVTLLARASAPVAVTLDGKEVGSTGTQGAILLHPLKAGKHEVLLRSKGFFDRKVELEVKAGQARLVGPYHLKVKPKPSTLVISLSEMFKDAQVRLAGKIVPTIKVGQPLPLPLNTKVELRVGMLGYDDHVETIDTSHDKALKTKLIALEEAVMGQVSVDSVPPGATIFLNGKKRDCVTPCRIQYLALHKRFRIKVAMAGYEPYTERFGFKGGRKIHTVDTKLKKREKASLAPLSAGTTVADGK